MPTPVSSDTLSGEALFILKSLKENQRMGRPGKLSEVKATLAPAVTMDFDTYFFFLRKHHYIALDREAQVRLTDQGEQVAEGRGLEKLSAEVAGFFSEHLGAGEVQTQAYTAMASAPSEAVEPPSLVVSRPRKTQLIEEAAAAAPAFPGRHEPEKPSAASLPQAVPPGALGGKGMDLDGRYSKSEALGVGPIGSVYKGRHNALGTDVAVKELKDIFGYFTFLQRGEVIKRLKKELCAQAQVRHPCVVAVLDQSTDIARPYVVMELLHESLRRRLDEAQGKGLEVRWTLRAFVQMLYGMKAAHEAGLTHHNLKPDNVLFDAFGNAKLGDFGLSRVIEVDQSKGMPQVFVGTGGMGYMAPELLARGKDVGVQADIYGLGMLLYEMLTGQLPGRRSPMPSEVRKEVPSKLDALFDKMTQDRREQRYTSLDGVLTDFYAAFPEGDFLGRGDLILRSEPPAPLAAPPAPTRKKPQ
jgi:hypothetical protein